MFYIEKLFQDESWCFGQKNQKYFEGKPNPEDIISPQAALALKTYLNFSTSVYIYKDLKKFTDSISKLFLPADYKVAKDCDNVHQMKKN